MVKDEVDIVEDWLLYHGYIFGFTNLYVIDNYSNDGTYEILQKYQKSKNIFLIREAYYTRKGDYMRHLIKDRIGRNYDIAYPLDIDEFIVLYDRETRKINITNIRVYLHNLPNNYTNYKTNYIYSTISSNDNYGYKIATQECQYGIYADYNILAKTFFNNRTWNGIIDHGNHFPNKNYLLTDLCLLHFHCRNIEQIKKKTINNVVGLGYDIHNLPDITARVGEHHIKRLREMNENRFNLDTNYIKTNESICLGEFTNFIQNLHKIFN